MTRIRTGGVWDEGDPQIYFLAVFPGMMDLLRGPFLVPANALDTAKSLDSIDRASMHSQMLLDSGAFNLANTHSKIHGIPLEAALALKPNEIDGYYLLLNHYKQIVRRYSDRCWGYIELDIGGAEEKTRARKALEDDGLSPIPVYHMLSDPPDYLDRLTEEYERICVGNLVNASRPLRRQMMATLWERLRKMPPTWVHLLGVTPSDMTFAYPFASVDSSTWADMRWPTVLKPRIAGRLMPELDASFKNAIGNRAQWDLAVGLGSYEAWMQARNWRNHVTTMGGLS